MKNTGEPRKAKTLGEAALNPDGIWNGARALSWISDVLTGGRGLSEQEVIEAFEKKRRQLSPPPKNW